MIGEDYRRSLPIASILMVICCVWADIVTAKVADVDASMICLLAAVNIFTLLFSVYGVYVYKKYRSEQFHPRKPLELLEYSDRFVDEENKIFYTDKFLRFMSDRFDMSEGEGKAAMELLLLQAYTDYTKEALYDPSHLYYRVECDKCGEELEGAVGEGTLYCVDNESECIEVICPKCGTKHYISKTGGYCMFSIYTCGTFTC